MQSNSTFSPQTLQGLTRNEAIQAELCQKAAAYPYFLPLKAVCGLLENEATAMQELPYFYGANPVVLHYLSAQLKETPPVPEAVPESPAIVGWEAKEGVEKGREAMAETTLPTPETAVETPETEIPENAEALAAEPMVTAAPTEEPIPENAEVVAAEVPETAAPESVSTEIPETAALEIEPPAPEPTELEVVAEAVAEDHTAAAETGAAPEEEPAAPAGEERPTARAAETPEISGNPAAETLAATPDAPDPHMPEEPVIQPLFTKDYFTHQGVSMGEDETAFDLRKPSGNDLMVMRSFGEWLRFFHSKKAKADEEQEDKRALKAMWQKGKLAAALEEEDEEIPEVVFEMAVKSISHEGNPATETMAKIYLAQGKWEKAVGVYEQLQLRNPQKSTYFAEKIAAIEQQHRP